MIFSIILAYNILTQYGRRIIRKKERKTGMNNNKANYCLQYSENTDAMCDTTLRYFISLENARKAMKEAFERMNEILQFPVGEEDDENYTVIENDSIQVSMEMDSYDWSIEPIKAEDAVGQYVDTAADMQSVAINSQKAALLEAYPELARYDDEDFRADLTRDNPAENGSDYEVVFEVMDERYYCFLHGTESMDEALGLFFKNHPHITYSMVFEHMEV